MYQTSSARRGPRGGLGVRRAAAISLTVLLLLAAVASSAAAGSSSSNSTLGPKNVAKGEPVKIGMVSDGTGPTLDNAYQITVVQALVKYVNERRGGIGGRPIELLHCETGQANASKSNECANQLIGEGVVAIMMPEATGVSAVHAVTSAASLPLFLYSITDTAVTTDPNSTFVMFDPRSGVSALPISVAKDKKLKKVTAVVIDVPAATDLYTSDSGKEPFKKARIDLVSVPIPPGQADMTPQMAEIANGDPTVVQIVGNDAFCISAFKGLQANGFKGPISTLFLCVTDSTRQAVGSYLKGTYVSTSVPVGDPKDPGLKQLKAIVKAYADEPVKDITMGQNSYAVFMGMYQAIEKMTGDITPATIAQTVKAMPNMKIPGGGGLVYRCNGKAKPPLVAVCTAGGLRTRLDAKGSPTLPYKVVGNGPVPD